MGLLGALPTLLEHRRAFGQKRAVLEARQLAKFRRLAQHAVTRSPYYARIAAERGIDPAQARPQDFPPLTKHDYVEHFDEISTHPRVKGAVLEEFLARSNDARELLDGRFHVVHTSGTSGRISYAVFNRAEWLRGAMQILRIVRLGWRRKIAYVGAAAGHYGGVALAKADTPLFAKLAYNTAVFDLHQPVDDLVRQLNAYQPRILMGYARGIGVLSEYQRHGDLDIHPRGIFTGGETLVSADAAAIRAAFGVSARNMYATSEHMYMGVAAPHREELYLFEDDLIYELQDESILVTNLFNFTVPMIRHRLNDVLRPTGELHGPFRLVENVIGRTEDVPFFVNEEGRRDFIHPIVIAEFYAPRLRSFQFRVADDSSFRFAVVLEPGLDEGERALTHRDIRERLDGLLAKKRMRNVRFDLEEVDELLAPERGKFRMVVTTPV